MNSQDREPLTPEERMLAERLASGSSAPSPAVDAAILAAARRAVHDDVDSARGGVPAPAPRATSRRRRRWPVALGAAASLALAVGLGWQLRPAPETVHAPWSESAMATRDTVPAAEAPAAARVSEPTQARRLDATAGPDAPVAATAAASDTTHATVENAPAELHMPPELHAPGWGAAPAADAGATAFGSDASTADPARTRADQAAEADRAGAARPQGIAIIEDVPDDDQPPASADAPEVRAAWLARVRELLDAGDIGAARASLAEFHRRHPDAELPPDLRALLD